MMEAFIKTYMGIAVYTLGISMLERVFGLKEKNNTGYNVLYLSYKVSFFLSFLGLWIIVFSFLSYFVYRSLYMITNQNLKTYLTFVLIMSFNLRGKNFIYLIIKFSLYDRFKHHKDWIEKSNEIILNAYRFIVYLIAFFILLLSNAFSLLEIENPIFIFNENVSVLNIAFTTVLGFDVMCDGLVKFCQYMKLLIAEQIKR